MKKSLTVVLIGLFFAACNQQRNDHKILKTQAVLNEFKDSVTDFGIVALVDKGSQKDTASVGVAFDSIRVSTRNRFCIGSCTKMYTAVAILKLQEKDF